MDKKSLVISGVVVLGVVLVANIYFFINGSQKKQLCYRESCKNLDANNQKCDVPRWNVQTLIKEEFKETTIELRYSAKCDASWSRAKVPVGSILYVEDAQGEKYGENYEVPNDKVLGEHYGNMGPGKKLKACVRLPDSKPLCTKLAG